MASELPRFYYHDHFTEMLSFVRRHYAHALHRGHQAFIDNFLQLDTMAQRLYVRLANRRAQVFAIEKLRYPEIGPIAEPLRTLHAGDWTGTPVAEDYPQVLACLTKPQLHAAACLQLAGISRRSRKSELIEILLDNVTASCMLNALGVDRFVVKRRTDVLGYLMFLYFGVTHERLEKFAMRDLGLVRTHAVADAFEPRFDNREDALQAWYFASRLEQLKSAIAKQRQDLVMEAASWPEPSCRAAEELRARLAYRLARQLEQSGLDDEAVAMYQRGSSMECSERLVRLLLRTGRREAARRQLEQCLLAPRSEEERLLATDLLQRRFGNRRTMPVTDALRESEIIEIDESQSGSPEHAAIAHFEKFGTQGFRAENKLWRTLFGLLFWDELFGGGSAALHSPFEAVPASLENRSFYDENASSIEMKLESLPQPAEVKRRILRTIAREYGRYNGIFRWHGSMTDTPFALLDAAEPQALRTVLELMCRNFNDMRAGFPDLLLIDADGCRFVEIKADGDQLRRNQLLRLEQLRTAGFRADVVRIRWILDPGQVYVVVDVETTGGSGHAHRMTELAAVKMQHGKVIDRFQTLLNPQRDIPTTITRVTGISNAMVANAPLFADIAEEFSEFMKDTIFVAHNVAFDYGFISREFARLGRTFRHPSLCTCASMRKLYPGYSSYSLAALCENHSIPLRRHHRALCDAEAAAELLLLVNEKRAAAAAAVNSAAG
jgi:DNA polymerase-3 subunit epsilon